MQSISKVKIVAECSKDLTSKKELKMWCITISFIINQTWINLWNTMGPIHLNTSCWYGSMAVHVFIVQMSFTYFSLFI